MSDDYHLGMVLLNTIHALSTLPDDAPGYGESGGAQWPLRDELIDALISVSPDPAQMRKAADHFKTQRESK